MNRRGFILGALAAPAVIRTPGLIMPVRPTRGTMVKFITPKARLYFPYLDALETPQQMTARFTIERFNTDVARALWAGDAI